MGWDGLGGRWDLARVFEPGLGRFAGAATFRTLGPDRWYYREWGRLTLASGWCGEAAREQVWVRDGATLRVHLITGAAGGAGDPTPGAVLHEVPMAALDGADGPASVHHCGADTYTGTYRFTGPDRFTVTVVVAGPDKDYRTHTVVERRAG